jgi:hypothetical protein
MWIFVSIQQLDPRAGERLAGSSARHFEHQAPLGSIRHDGDDNLDD